LPEFFYLDLYEEKHRTLQIAEEGDKIIQKGIREYLLCQQCETKLSKYEKYAKELIIEIPNFSRNDELGVLYSENVDYTKFKLFQLSLLWRSGVSSHVSFSQIDLGPHEEKIHRMLDEENPGKVSEYGCMLSLIPNTELIHKIIQSPTRFTKKLFGHAAFKFSIGNLTWVFVVSSHKPHPSMRELFLQESGVLRVMLSRRDENLEIIKIGQILQGFGRGF
jgi:hypothetical protein